MGTADQWSGVAQGVQDHESLCVWPVAPQGPGGANASGCLLVQARLAPASASRA
jgi:hypothetical protein